MVTADRNIMDEVKAILKAFDRLKKRGSILAERLHRDAGLPFVVTTFDGDQRSLEARLAAIDSLVRLHHVKRTGELPDALPGVLQQPSFHAGILCVSEKTCSAAVRFNKAKDAFKTTVTELRKMHQESKTRFDRLMEKLHGPAHQRPQELTDLMRIARMSEVDLSRCYAQVRILPPHTQSVSWTWAVNHSTMKQIRMKEALSRARDISDPDNMDRIIKLINDVGDQQLLIEKKTLPAALRANLVFENADPLKPGPFARTTVTISGVLLYQDKSLPRFLWREDPGTPGSHRPQRLPRMPKFNHLADLYIKKFSWYIRDRDHDEKPFKNV